MSTTTSFAVRWALGDCRTTRSEKMPAPHQTTALAKLGAWYATPAPGKGGLLALPTGGGKTFTAAHFLCNSALSDGYKVLWLAHTHHLLEQAFGAFDAGVLRHVREPRDALCFRVVSGTPGHYAPSEILTTDDVVVATLQTVTRAYGEKVEALLRFLESAGGKLFVVFDEAHHAPAPSYRRLLEALRAEHGATLLGLTATPTYTNESKRGWLRTLFPQGVLASARATDLIAEGILARPHFEPYPTSVKPDFAERDYQKWLGTFRDIPESVVQKLAENAERNELIAATYADNRAKYGKTIIFTDRWFQCEAILQALAKRGVKRAGAVYSHVDAPLPYEKRQKRDRNENAKVLEQFRRGDLDVLVNVRMLTEGTDLPNAQTVFITRQTTSQILMTQMIGRALRGPKFGGTSDAYVVLFMDEWQHAIGFAKLDDIDGGTSTDAPPRPDRPPLQLISIDLVKKLARQMDSGVNRTSAPFLSLMPEGWFHVTFDARRAGSDDVELEEQLVLVFDDERAGFDAAIKELLESGAGGLPDEDAEIEAWHPRLEALRERHLGSVARDAVDVIYDLFLIARHVAQNERSPQFFRYEARKEHDLDAIAREHAHRDLRMSEVKAALEHEYARKDRFWRTIFTRFEQFRSFYDACTARLDGAGEEPGVVPSALPPPTPREVSEDVKKQVVRRDGGRCLACGGTRLLQVDHILPRLHGGSHDLDNLQTLCKSCNQRKDTRRMRFTAQTTSLRSPPEALEHFEDPDDAGNRDHWERFLRRTVNFTYQCAAASRVVVGGRGESYYNWTIELVSGNPPGWLEPHLEDLFSRIQSARSRAGKPEIASITVRGPDGEEVCYPRAR